MKRPLPLLSNFQFLPIALALLLGLLLARLPLTVGGGLVVATAVILLTIIQPLVGLGAALLLGPWGALENVVLGTSLLDSGQVLLLLTIAIWLARGMARKEIIIPHLYLNVPLAIFVGVTAVTLLNARSLPFGLRELIKWLEIGVIMWLVADVGTQNTKHETRNSFFRNSHFVLFLLLLAGLSQALIGIWQFGLRNNGPEHFLVMGRFYRAYGTFEQPNPFGGFMNLTALLAIGAFVGLIIPYLQQIKIGDWGLGIRVRRVTALTLFTGFVALTATLALLFSWSRGAWLGFAGGVGMMALFLPKKRWQGILFVAVIGVVSVTAVGIGQQLNIGPANSIIARFSDLGQGLTIGGDVRGVDINDANYAELERLAHWQAALNMARDNLWLGVGFGNYEPAYADYALINWPAALGHAHNYYLNLLAEIGIIGLLAYLVLWGAIIWQTLRVLRQADWPERGIALGLLGAWTALTVHHVVDKLYVNNIYIHLGVMLGLLQLLDRATSLKIREAS